jgi:molecular chaperone DnaJ
MDPYQVLGVNRKATQDEIARAYRTLAAKHHPDRNPENQQESAAKFKEVTAAFEMIGSEDKRKRYDLYGEQPPSFSFRSRNSVDDVFDNIFEHVFGNQKRGPGGSKMRVRISLKEAFTGCERTVQAEKHKFCDTCKGTGSSSWEPCHHCSGRGFVIVGSGQMRVQSSCAQCHGRGSLSKTKCDNCQGKGYNVDSVKDVVVRIPPGIDDGSQIRMAGEAADDGDLFVVVNVDRDENFARQDRMLMGGVDVPYHLLVMGGSVSLDLFGVKISVKVPPRTPAGSRVRIKGQGMPFLQNPAVRGDLFVDLRLKMPKSVCKEHEKLLKALAKLDDKD